MRSLQQAADDVGKIAEAAECLSKMLDRFYAEHGEALYEQLKEVWPGAYDIGSAARPLYALERRWTPPEG